MKKTKKTKRIFTLDSRVKVIGNVPKQLHGEFGTIVATQHKNDFYKVLLDRDRRVVYTGTVLELAYWFRSKELQEESEL